MSLTSQSRLDDLKKKIFITGLLLIVYRISAQVPIPGVNAAALQSYWGGAGNSVFDLINTFSGGAFKRLSVIALGIMPYITTSIIFSLLGEVFPTLQELQEDSEGHKKIQKWTRYATVVLCLFQGYGMATFFETFQSQNGAAVIPDPGLFFRITTTITLTAGTMFLLWLGERMTEYGLENGVSLIIFAGIAVELPTELMNNVTLYNNNELSGFKLLAIVATIAVCFYIVSFIEKSFRGVPVQYAKKVVHNRVYGGAQTLPVRVDTAGVMPPILAYSLISAPATVLGFLPQDSFLKPYVEILTNSILPGKLGFNVLLGVLIVYMAFFYAPIQFKTKKIAEQLQKNNAFIPGVRPGGKTKEYLDGILNRLTSFAAVYLCVICIMPSSVVGSATRLGGTAMLILVSVSIRVMMNIQTYLQSERYENAYKVRGKHKGQKKRF